MKDPWLKKRIVNLRLQCLYEFIEISVRGRVRRLAEMITYVSIIILQRSDL